MAFNGEGAIAANGIVNDSSDGNTAFDDGGQDTKQRQPPGEVAGAIDGIDDDGHISVSNLVEEAAIFFNRFFTDKDGLRECLGNGCLDCGFGCFIGIGDQIQGRGFLADCAFTETAEARHDFLIGGNCHDIGQTFQIFSCEGHGLVVSLLA